MSMWNAQVGDRVYFRRRNIHHDPQGPYAWGSWEKDWKVSQVGLFNEHGIKRNIEIVHDRLPTMVVAPGRAIREEELFDILILPPASEYQQYDQLTNVLVNKDLVLTRCVHNSTEPVYEIVCLNCGKCLYNHIEQTEVSDLRFRPGNVVEGDEEATGFEESKPDLDEGHTSTRCGCKDLEYEMPEVQQYC